MREIIAIILFSLSSIASAAYFPQWYPNTNPNLSEGQKRTERMFEQYEYERRQREIDNDQEELRRKIEQLEQRMKRYNEE